MVPGHQGCICREIWNRQPSARTLCRHFDPSRGRTRLSCRILCALHDPGIGSRRGWRRATFNVHREYWTRSVDRVLGPVRPGRRSRTPATSHGGTDSPCSERRRHRNVTHPLHADSRSIRHLRYVTRLIVIFAQGAPCSFLWDRMSSEISSFLIYVCVAMASLSMIASLATEWRNVKAGAKA